MFGETENSVNPYVLVASTPPLGGRMGGGRVVEGSFALYHLKFYGRSFQCECSFRTVISRRQITMRRERGQSFLLTACDTFSAKLVKEITFSA